MSKVMLIVIDGLGLETARRQLGFLEGLVEVGEARLWPMRAVLPSLSRPAYESILTGLPPARHGITSNWMARRSTQASIFTVARAHGRSTGAAAYSWFAELANGVPFDPVTDREQDDADGPIQHGRYYVLDPFPDPELYWQADLLVRRHTPDLMLVHPMGCDYAGHEHGGGSLAYRQAAALTDDCLARIVPAWRAAGYRIIVTADHGMSADGHHGGTTAEERHVPFYLLDNTHGCGVSEEADQLSVAPTVLSLMGLAPAPTMTAPSLVAAPKSNPS